MASIVETMTGIRRGKFINNADAALTELLKKIAEHQAGGEIQITLKFDWKTEGQLVVKPKVKVKSPMPEAGDGIFYVTDDGELERTDPKQGDFDNEWGRATGGKRKDLDD